MLSKLNDSIKHYWCSFLSDLHFYQFKLEFVLVVMVHWVVEAAGQWWLMHVQRKDRGGRKDRGVAGSGIRGGEGEEREKDGQGKLRRKS